VLVYNFVGTAYSWIRGSARAPAFIPADSDTSHTSAVATPGIENANMAVGETCYIADADCADGLRDSPQMVYDCQLTIDGKVYQSETVCAGSDEGVDCLVGNSYYGNYSDYSAGVPSNAGVTAVSFERNAGPFYTNTSVYAFMCTCSQASRRQRSHSGRRRLVVYFIRDSPSKIC
jgi:hypothetical protein